MKLMPLAVLPFLAAASLAAQVPAPYREATLPVEVRVQDLLGRMTAEEKFWQLYMIPGDLDDPAHDYSHGVYGLQVSPRPEATSARAQAERINAIQHYFVEQTRLGIPIIPFDEALHGLARPDATSFPQSIALAATFDTALVGGVARAIAQETGSRGIRQVLSPMINIASDVRWGRTEESYGEDPFLVSTMGLAYVEALERAGTATTPKHFVANVGEGGRDSYPIDAAPRELEERFFPPFRALLGVGAARSVMTAYNSVDGKPATQDPWLLTTVLRQEWGYRGVILSDAAATGGATVLHYTEPDTPTAAQHAWEAGLDVVFQSSWPQYRPYWAAIERGMVAPAIVDSAVAHVLRLKFSLGLFEHPYVNADSAQVAAGTPTHLALARDAARAAMVLLKNEGNTLPLARSVRSIAVIGADATEGRLGGYSGPGTRVVTILDGIRSAAPRAVVRHVPGPGRRSPEYLVVPVSALRNARGAGLQGEYFTNITLTGTPQVVRTDPQVDFAWTLGTPGERVAGDWYSARWTGTLTASAGLTRLGVEGDDGYRLWVDGRLLIDRWTPGTHRATLRPVRFAPGSRHSLKLEFHSSTPNGRIRLIWDAGSDRSWQRRIVEAVAVTRQSSVAVVVAGIEEGEFRDRSRLALPGHQEELIRAVAATGRPTIVVLVGGSAITMSSWLDAADAVLLAWYPGQEGGHALADLLFGNTSPSGRLPITFPVSEGQLPLRYDHRPTGRGDDYLDGTGEALFPFGFGLSYSSFEYSGMSVSHDRAAGALPVTVRCTVTNTGTHPAAEVVQLYVHDEIASRTRPVMQLRDFARIHLAPGESREVLFTLDAEDLQMVNGDGRWVVEPGSFRVMIGASSKDIRLQERITVR
jgi:beta-glucosidase